MIGGGALGQQAATAVRHVAAQNGVWSLGNFGGVPPKSAMMYHSPGSDMSQPEEVSSQSDGSILPNKIIESDYRHVFNSCGVGMVSFLLLLPWFVDAAIVFLHALASISSLCCHHLTFKGHCIYGRGIH